MSIRLRLRLPLRPAVAAEALAVAILLGPLAGSAWGLSGPPNAATTWTLNVYDPRAFRWQDPDPMACTAASTVMMLNMGVVRADRGAGSLSSAGDSPLRWRLNTTYAEQETILAYSRANMTMRPTSAGTDPHGWRNALNYYGWGSVDAGVYRDSSYSSFDAAAHAVVVSLARYGRPVGILARAGRHSQVVTGYTVMGPDPRLGDGFTVVGVYVTDPLRSHAMRNTWVSWHNWQSGPTSAAFTPYQETDSPFVDPIDGQVSRAEWFGKWVVVDAVR